MKGVISFTFNLVAKRCYLRVHHELKPELLCQAVSSVGHLTGRQVVKNENGEEVGVFAPNRRIVMICLSVFLSVCLFQVLLSYGPSPEASLQDEKENKPVKVHHKWVVR